MNEKLNIINSNLNYHKHSFYLMNDLNMKERVGIYVLKLKKGNKYYIQTIVT